MNELMLVRILSVTAVLALLIALILQRHSCRRLKRQLTQLEELPQRVAPAPEIFSQDLVQAERNQERPPTYERQAIPDRYRYISAMARQGMGADQIAAALQIGEAEAAQIVRLAQLKAGSNLVVALN